VYGRSRVPEPPACSTTFIAFPFFDSVRGEGNISLAKRIVQMDEDRKKTGDANHS
jgi:hypothetical protein